MLGRLLLLGCRPRRRPTGRLDGVLARSAPGPPGYSPATPSWAGTAVRRGRTAAGLGRGSAHLHQVHVAVQAAGLAVHQVLQVLALVGVWRGVER